VTQTRNLAAQVLAALPVDLFRALGDPNRVALVAWLARQRGAKTVSEIVASECCPVDFSVVSRHLHTLRDARVVEAERSGREVRYRLGVASLAQTLRHLADLLERCCKE
jgi:DNA-binding transcriptional ArsR family regulator